MKALGDFCPIGQVKITLGHLKRRTQYSEGVNTSASEGTKLTLTLKQEHDRSFLSRGLTTFSFISVNPNLDPNPGTSYQNFGKIEKKPDHRHSANHQFFPHSPCPSQQECPSFIEQLYTQNSKSKFFLQLTPDHGGTSVLL